MARLPQGVTKRKDGLLQKRFTVQGKRYSIYAHTLDELANKEQDKRLEIANGVYKANKSITLDSYFEEFLEHKAKSIKGNTLYNYKCLYYKHISPTLGKGKIKAIEKRQCKELQDSLFEKYNENTTNRALLVLSIVLNSAVSDDIITKNPMQGLKAIKQSKQKATQTIHKALTEEEQKALLEQLRIDNEFYYECICFMLATGLRVGECTALTWKDIDYKANIIHVTKTVSKDINGHKIIASPKTECSIRDIPMNDTIKRILKEQRKKYLLLWQANGEKMHDRIFTTPYGEIPNSQAVSMELTRAIKHLNENGNPIQRITCHGLRDTFATRYIEQGGSPQTLKTILGHSSLAMTMDLYSQVLPNTKQEEMNKLNIIGL